MKLQTFTALEKMEQQRVLQKMGVKLAEKTQPDFKYELYQLDDFYVEIKIQMPGGVELIGLQTFETAAELDPYLHVMKTETGAID